MSIFDEVSRSLWNPSSSSMTLINPFISRTDEAIEPRFFSSYFIMEPGALYSFIPVTEMVVTDNGMVSVSIIIIN